MLTYLYTNFGGADLPARAPSRGPALQRLRASSLFEGKLYVSLFRSIEFEIALAVLCSDALWLLPSKRVDDDLIETSEPWAAVPIRTLRRLPGAGSNAELAAEAARASARGRTSWCAHYELITLEAAPATTSGTSIRINLWVPHKGADDSVASAGLRATLCSLFRTSLVARAARLSPTVSTEFYDTRSVSRRSVRDRSAHHAASSHHPSAGAIDGDDVDVVAARALIAKLQHALEAASHLLNVNDATGATDDARKGAAVSRGPAHGRSAADAAALRAATKALLMAAATFEHATSHLSRSATLKKEFFISPVLENTRWGVRAAVSAAAESAQVLSLATAAGAEDAFPGVPAHVVLHLQAARIHFAASLLRALLALAQGSTGVKGRWALVRPAGGALSLESVLHALSFDAEAAVRLSAAYALVDVVGGAAPPESAAAAVASATCARTVMTAQVPSDAAASATVVGQQVDVVVDGAAAGSATVATLSISRSLHSTDRALAALAAISMPARAGSEKSASPWLSRRDTGMSHSHQNDADSPILAFGRPQNNDGRPAAHARIAPNVERYEAFDTSRIDISSAIKATCSTIGTTRAAIAERADEASGLMTATMPAPKDAEMIGARIGADRDAHHLSSSPLVIPLHGGGASEAVGGGMTRAALAATAMSRALFSTSVGGGGGVGDAELLGAVLSSSSSMRVGGEDGGGLGASFSNATWDALEPRLAASIREAISAAVAFSTSAAMLIAELEDVLLCSVTQPSSKITGALERALGTNSTGFGGGAAGVGLGAASSTLVAHVNYSRVSAPGVTLKPHIPAAHDLNAHLIGIAGADPDGYDAENALHRSHAGVRGESEPERISHALARESDRTQSVIFRSGPAALAYIAEGHAAPTLLSDAFALIPQADAVSLVTRVAFNVSRLLEIASTAHHVWLSERPLHTATATRQEWLPLSETHAAESRTGCDSVEQPGVNQTNGATRFDENTTGDAAALEGPPPPPIQTPATAAEPSPTGQTPATAAEPSPTPATAAEPSPTDAALPPTAAASLRSSVFSRFFSWGRRPTHSTLPASVVTTSNDGAVSDPSVSGGAVVDTGRVADQGGEPHAPLLASPAVTEDAEADADVPSDSTAGPTEESYVAAGDSYVRAHTGTSALQQTLDASAATRASRVVGPGGDGPEYRDAAFPLALERNLRALRALVLRWGRGESHVRSALMTGVRKGLGRFFAQTMGAEGVTLASVLRTLHTHDSFFEESGVILRELAGAL